MNKKLVADPQTYAHHCSCGQPHPSADARWYCGDDATDVLAADLKAHLGKGSALVLADANTHAAAGRVVAAQLEARRVRHALLILSGDVSATEETARQVREGASEHDLIVAVGAGTINDLGKFAAAGQDRPYWVFPTAPSMNGFTSAIAAIKVDGVKRTLPAPPPRVIYVDPAVIAHAPRELLQSGYCDVMAKSVSDIDWQIESLLFSGSYCGLPSALVAATERTYLDGPEKLSTGDRATAMALLEGLLVSGTAMSLAGSSAPASGGEHLFSHFLDMREAISGRNPELHGLQVAAGIIVSAACYRRLSSLDASVLKRRAKALCRMEMKRLPGIWEGLAAEVEKRFTRKKDALLLLDERLPEKWTAVRSLCRQVQTPEYYRDRMRRTGFALTLTALNLSVEEFLLAATTARAIRERITVLDIAAQAGVLETAAADALVLLR